VASEFNFDGIVGPTHNYSGLSYGNVASTQHHGRVSSPKSAALQGLAKMKFVRDLGIGQCLLPPLKRPDLGFLRNIGFTGTDAQVIQSADRADPILLSIAYSASSMWTANAATVSPSVDASDGRLHLTPANLETYLHRSLESNSTTRILQSIFANEEQFCVHPALPSAAALSDEGAANHTRLCGEYGGTGLHLFVYGRRALDKRNQVPTNFPARQTLEASQAIARRHLLDPNRVLFIQQNPRAVDAGVFHNDVICVGNQNVLLCHQDAFVDQATVLAEVRRRFESLDDEELTIREFSRDEISLRDAVQSYLFNSQLVTLPDGGMSLFCPTECQSNAAASRCIDRLLAEDNPIQQAHYIDLRQSMNNGGGPACLRLRVVLTDRQRARLHPGIVLTDALYGQLVRWVHGHYRDELCPDDLRDPSLIDESYRAAVALANILQLPIV
jgi:succinylarginine dihydrolase